MNYHQAEKVANAGGIVTMVIVNNIKDVHGKYILSLYEFQYDRFKGSETDTFEKFVKFFDRGRDVNSYVIFR